MPEKCTKRTQKITSLYIKNRSFLTLIFSCAVWWSSDAHLIQTWFPYWSILVLSKVHLVQPQNAFLDKDVPVLYICPQMTPLYRFLWSSEIYIFKKYNVLLQICKWLIYSRITSNRKITLERYHDAKDLYTTDWEKAFIISIYRIVFDRFPYNS